MMHDLRTEIQTALNKHSAENGSNTPDFILADYLTSCLSAFDRATQAREEWGRIPEPTPTEHIVSDTEECWCQPTVIKVPGKGDDAPWPTASIWDDTTEPGGWVCPACGKPTESEPCAEHQGQDAPERNQP